MVGAKSERDIVKPAPDVLAVCRADVLQRAVKLCTGGCGTAVATAGWLALHPLVVQWITGPWVAHTAGGRLFPSRMMPTHSS